MPRRPVHRGMACRTGLSVRGAGAFAVQGFDVVWRERPLVIRGVTAELEDRHVVLILLSVIVLMGRVIFLRVLDGVRERIDILEGRGMGEGAVPPPVSGDVVRGAPDAGVASTGTGAAQRRSSEEQGPAERCQVPESRVSSHSGVRLPSFDLCRPHVYGRWVNAGCLLSGRRDNARALLREGKVS